VADEQKNYGSKSLICELKAKSQEPIHQQKKAAFRQPGLKTKAGSILPQATNSLPTY
jgi:hypothetical protein